MPAKYRADHIGSLLRPAELLQARGANSDTAQLRALEDRHILRVIDRQKELGFKIFTDGELRRGNFMSDFNDAVEGIDQGVAVPRTWQTETGASPRPSMVPGTIVAKIKQKRRLTGHEFAFLKQHSPGDVKVTLPTANQFPAIYYKKGISDKIYPTYSDFLLDIVPIFKAEIQALVNEGAQYMQIDAPRYSYYIDPKWRSYVRTEMGLDPGQALDEAIRADNACLAGARRQASCWRFTSAAATTAASGMPKAATTRSPKNYSASSTSMRFCSSTNRSAPAPSNLCASCRAARRGSRSRKQQAAGNGGVG